jgi:[ribosomal protein S5]-alanine N-acetyltransferase
MINLLLKTERCFLETTSKERIEAYKKEGLSNYYRWMGDEDVNQYNSHGLFPQSQKELDIFLDRCENDKSLLSFCMIDRKTLNHIGMVSLQRIDLINRSAEFAIIIGEIDYWGKGYATEALEKLLEFGFLKLGLNRIWSATAEVNYGMLNVFKKVNMKYEGTYREGLFLNGKFEDVIAFSIIRRDWDLINEK